MYLFLVRLLQLTRTGRACQGTRKVLVLSISSYAGNQISTLPYEAVPRERVSQESEQQIGMQTGLRDPSTAAASSVLRIQSLLRRKSPVRTD